MVDSLSHILLVVILELFENDVTALRLITLTLVAVHS